QAATQLDRVFVINVEEQDPPLETGSLDCILYGDVLGHLIDPEAVLRRHRRLLSPQCAILCSGPNVQHHTVVRALFKSDFQYTTSGLLDATHLRFFTYSTFTKLLLDAGFAPEILTALPGSPCPEPWLQASEPLLRQLGLHPQ